VSSEFYTQNRKWANCIGIFEEPLWPFSDSKTVESWDQRPIANGNIGGVNNIRTVKLK